MRKIVQSKFDEIYYEQTLSNLLQVVIWSKKDFSTTSCVFATPYGSNDYKQVINDGELIENNAGIAHFLEHKMFEQDDSDVMSDFSRLGANVNAFTSYNETAYTFTTAKKDISEPLNLLLDFVQKLSITQESVEKEKGIIIQELAMYKQMADSRLFFETLKNLFHNHPLKIDIGGDSESVSKISKEELEQCYKINYHPSKMTLIITTPCDPIEVMKIIETNQNKKTFDEPILNERFKEEESETTVVKYASIDMDVAINKVTYSYKLKPLNCDSLQRCKSEWAIRFILELYFSSMNPNYQNWLDEEVINDYFFTEIDLGKDYGYIIFGNECEKAEKFKEFVINEMANLLKFELLNLESLNQLKKRYQGQALRTFNNTEDISTSYIRYKYNGLSIFETIEAIESLNIAFVKDMINSLDLSNDLLFEIKPLN